MCSNFSTFPSILFAIFLISHPNSCEITVSLFSLLLLCFFFPEPGVMWDLSSLTRDPTLPLQWKLGFLTMGLSFFWFWPYRSSLSWGKDSCFVIPVCVGLPQDTALCFLSGWGIKKTSKLKISIPRESWISHFIKIRKAIPSPSWQPCVSLWVFQGFALGALHPGLAGCLSGTLRLKTLLLADRVVGRGGHLQAPLVLPPAPSSSLSHYCHRVSFTCGWLVNFLSLS